VKGVFLVVCAAALWALDTLIRYPLLGKGISPEAIVTTEHVILAVIFLPYVFKKFGRFARMTLIDLFFLTFVGAMGSALSTLAFTKAFTVINPSLVILLQKFQPVVAIILARLVLREPIRKQFLLWAGICLLGGLLISAKDIWGGVSHLFNGNINSKNAVGYGLALVAVVSWGSATVFGKRLSMSGFSTREIMAGRFIIGALVLLPLGKNVIVLPVNGSQTAFLQILFMVLMSGLLAMYLYYLGLKKIPARICSLTEMFFPFMAVIVNWVFLGETLGVAQIVGGLLLILGSTVVQLKHY